MERYLLDDSRVDRASLETLDAARLDEIASAYKSRKVRLVAAVVRLLRGSAEATRGAS